MTSSYYLRENIFLCPIDTSVVGMDVQKNRYFSFSEGQSSWLREIMEAPRPDALSTKAASFAQHLLRKRILETDAATSKPLEYCDLPSPHASVLDEPPFQQQPWRIADLFLFAYVLLYAWIVWRMQRNHIDRLLAATMRWKRHAAPHASVSTEKVIRRTAAFHAMAPYLLTTHDVCFFRSLCLVRYLSLFRIDCDMVFGVRTVPFGAHCWVERDGVVLNDHRDNALVYTKIVSV